MPWAQFDDHSPDSLAWLKAGGEPLGLHVLATCWCAAHLSDGTIPATIVEHYRSRFADLDEMVRRLEAAGLWEPVEDGWRLPGFLDDNRSRDQVAADRKRRQERARRGGRAKAQKDRQASEKDRQASEIPY